MTNSIIVLCNNFQDACDAFDIFVQYLDELWPIDTSSFCDSFANIVETDRGIRYYFIDEKYRNLYKNVSQDSIYVDDFLEGIATGGERIYVVEPYVRRHF